MCMRKLRERMATSDTQLDFFQQSLYDKEGKVAGATIHVDGTRATVIMNARSEFMATTMFNTLYLLLKTLDALRKPWAEVDPTPNADVVASFQHINGLKYLRACLDKVIAREAVNLPGTSL